jgi:hypothetical protein
MKTHFRLLIALALFIFPATLAAQQSGTGKNSQERSFAASAALGTAKAGLIVIGSAAKGTWLTTKFVSGSVVKPLLLKGTPKAAKIMLKSGGFGVKRLLPLAVKFGLL